MLFILYIVYVVYAVKAFDVDNATSNCGKNCLNQIIKSEKIVAQDYYYTTPTYTKYPEKQPPQHFFTYYGSNKPVVLLLDNTKEAHVEAQKFMTNPNTRTTEFLLIKYNNTGATQILASNRDIQSMRIALKWYDDNEIFNTSVIEIENFNKSAVFFGILQATRFLPLNGGILIFTSRGAADEDIAQLALQEVHRKNIRVYIVWIGTYPTLHNEEVILKEIALRSQGEFFVDSMTNLSQKNFLLYAHSEDAKKPKSIIAARYKLHGNENIYFPIDSNVSNIHITLSSIVTTAILKTSNGNTINLLNKIEVENFSLKSFLIEDKYLDTWEIHLQTDNIKSTPVVGMWHLNTNSLNERPQGYRIVISIQTKLTTHVQLMKRHDKVPTKKKLLKNYVKLNVNGEVSEINKIKFIDENGKLIKGNIDFTSNKIKKEDITEDVENIEVNGDEIKIEDSNIPEKPFYIEINGKDNEGNNFTRLSYVNTKTIIDNKLPSLTVEVGLGSQLLVKQNELAQIYFEVTNNRDYTIMVNFRCRDEKSWLVRMQPLFAWLNPRQNAIVTLTIRPGLTGSAGYRDLITFTATGTDITDKTVIVKSNNYVNSDTEEPKLYHKYTSDCMNVLIGNCEDGTWAIEATAQDMETGLLQLTSNPSALYFPNGYIAGTTESVTGYYTGSCCQPKLQLTAVDLKNNRKTYTANAYNNILSTGSIAAIVLGILILIIIIIIITVICKKKCKENRSIELSTYRGPSSRY